MQTPQTPIQSGTVSGSIELELSIDAAFAALSQAAIRSVWARLPGHDRSYELDFREGGSELRSSTFPNIGRDEVLDVRTRFIEIVPPRRVVETVELRLDGVLRTVALVAWELSAVDGGTQVDYLDQYQVLTLTGDGSADHKERRGVTPMLLRGVKIAAEQAAQHS